MVREPLDTPLLTVDLPILENNLKRMGAFAKKHGLQLTPHIKSHKVPELAKMQISYGSFGITAAKLGEALVMADHGIREILLAYPVVTHIKMEGLYKLSRRVRLRGLVDTYTGINRLGSFFASKNEELPVFLKIDTGLHRCGVPPNQEAVELARLILSSKGLSFLGILTHAGHVYGANNRQEMEDIARREGREMVQLKKLLEKEGIPVSQVSLGSTPTVGISGTYEGVTEIRPGNYIFHDAMQMNLGIAKEEDCALRVRTTVISRHKGRAIIDAGSKALGLDQGAHGKSTLKGYGLVRGRGSTTISALSEEHGIIFLPPTEKGFTIGEELEIIPNHACAVINNFPIVHLFRGETLVGIYEVAARGKLQ